MLLFSDTGQMKVNRCPRCIWVSKYNYPPLQLAQEGYRTRQNNKHTCLCFLPLIFLDMSESFLSFLSELCVIWGGSCSLDPFLNILKYLALALSSLYSHFSSSLANPTLREALPSLPQKVLRFEITFI